MRMMRGELVGLVPLQSTDELALYKWLNDPKMRRTAGQQTWKACYSLEQVQDIIRERSAQPSRLDLVVIDLAKEQPLGLMELTHLRPMSDSAGLGMIWGENGDEDRMIEALTLTVSFAFDSQGLHRVWTRVPSSERDRMIGLQKIGFEVEGVLREDHFTGGAWRDSVLLSILSAEARPC